MRTRWLAEVRGRVDRFNRERETAAVLSSDALGDALSLVCSVPDPLADIEVAQAAGWLFWSRFAARASDEGEPDLSTALDLLAPVYQRHPEGLPTLICELFDRDPPTGTDSATVLARLGRMLYREALGTGDTAALERAVDLLRRAVAAAGTGHPGRVRCLANLGSVLLTRFETAGSPADLEEAIELGRASVAGTAPDHPDRAMYLSNLGNALLTRFEHLGAEADLDAAIDAGQAAVDGWPGHPDHAAMVSNLDLALRTRAAYRDRVSDLDTLIDRARRAAAMPPGGPSGRADRAAELGRALLARFERFGDPADLEEAVAASRAAVAAAAAHERAEHLSDLSDLLRIRFVHAGDEQDLAEAVTAGRAAVAEAPADDPGLSGWQCNLANALCLLHRHTGARADLDEAVALLRNTVAATTPDDPDHASYLSNLGDVLRVLFERTGDEADLDAAVDAGRAAVAAAPRGHPGLAAYLGNLGAALLTRFRRLGGQADLDESVEVLRRAVVAAPPGGPDRGTMLANLGGALQVRFDSVRRPEDLDEAIDVSRKAVLATPRDHSSRAVRLSNFGAALQARYAITGVPADIDEAVAAGQVAVAALPAGHPRRAPALSHHAIVLRRRGGPADLDAAVDAARGAVTAVPLDHPDRAGYLVNLGQALGDRFARTKDDADLDEALAACREGAAAEIAPPRVRAVAAGGWAHLAAKAERWQDAVAGFTAAVDLVGRTVPRSLTRRDQEFLLDGMSGVGSDAAACCVRAGLIGRGVELFEQGRGLLLSQALDGRTDLTALAERHPDRAGRFSALCAALDRPGESTPAERRATAAAFDRLIAEIRELPGFDGFLRPAVVRDLAPEGGHVVIVNVSPYGSDALIVAAGTEPVAVPLPGLTPDVVLAEARAFLDAVGDTSAGQRRMTRTLGWLWDTVAGPVLDRLGVSGPPPDGEPWPRVWWCASGAMSFLPLHAAGRHDGSSDTVIDRVVGSSIPTLRALAHSRRGAAASPSGGDRAVVVAMPHTPGGSPDLPGAEAEEAVVRHYFPGTVDVLTGTAATSDAVRAALPGARWAHFACHGHSDLADPSSSRLLLADHHTDPLTVVDLAALRTDGTELAFLSACSTARPGARLTDEAIHLASAFQLAGYPHVIGTLWPIDDQQAVDMANRVYRAITATGDVAGAVHTATRQVRDRWPDRPSLWASYVHVGA